MTPAQIASHNEPMSRETAADRLRWYVQELRRMDAEHAEANRLRANLLRSARQDSFDVKAIKEGRGAEITANAKKYMEIVKEWKASR